MDVLMLFVILGTTKLYCSPLAADIRYSRSRDALALLTCCSPVASLLKSLFYVKKIVCPCVQLSTGPSYNTAQNIDT